MFSSHNLHKARPQALVVIEPVCRYRPLGDSNDDDGWEGDGSVLLQLLHHRFQGLGSAEIVQGEARSL
jgi:hypothetical protein